MTTLLAEAADTADRLDAFARLAVQLYRVSSPLVNRTAMTEGRSVAQRPEGASTTRLWPAAADIVGSDGGILRMVAEDDISG